MEAIPVYIHQGGYTSGRLYLQVYTSGKLYPGRLYLGLYLRVYTMVGIPGYTSGCTPWWVSLRCTSGCTMVGILQVCTTGVPLGVPQ